MLDTYTYGPTPSLQVIAAQDQDIPPPHTHVHTQTARIAHTASLTRDTNVTRILAIILPTNSGR